jgi:hypothetical protein
MPPHPARPPRVSLATHLEVQRRAPARLNGTGPRAFSRNHVRRPKATPTATIHAIGITQERERQRARVGIRAARTRPRLTSTRGDQAGGRVGPSAGAGTYRGCHLSRDRLRDKRGKWVGLARQTAMATCSAPAGHAGAGWVEPSRAGPVTPAPEGARGCAVRPPPSFTRVPLLPSAVLLLAASCDAALLRLLRCPRFFTAAQKSPIQASTKEPMETLQATDESAALW